MAGSSMVSKRKARYEKSTRGCKTCKIRRVKCDETLPWCVRCTSTGRQCEGPQPPEVAFVPQSIKYDQYENVINTPSLTISTRSSRSSSKASFTFNSPPYCIRELSCSPWSHKPFHEQQIFHYFLERTAPVISGAKEDQFWLRVLPHIASYSDVVWNSILAIGALWGYPVQFSNGTLVTGLPLTNRQLQAFEWYDKAITSHQQIWRLSAKPTELMLTTTTFATFELQKGGYENGLRLIRTGFLLLSHLLSEDQTNHGWCDEVIVKMYMRSACLYATSEQEGYFEADDFQDLPGARETLFRLMFAVFGLLKEYYFCFSEEDAHAYRNIHENHIHLGQSMHRWKARLDQLFNITLDHESVTSAAPPAWSYALARELEILSMYHETILTWLRIDPDADSQRDSPDSSTSSDSKFTVTDSLTPFFQQIINLTKSILRQHGHTQPHDRHSTNKSASTHTHTLSSADARVPQLPAYFMDITILPPLYFTLVMSADTSIRRETLDLLQRYTTQTEDEQLHGLVITPRYNYFETRSGTSRNSNSSRSSPSTSTSTASSTSPASARSSDFEGDFGTHTGDGSIQQDSNAGVGIDIYGYGRGGDGAIANHKNSRYQPGSGHGHGSDSVTGVACTTRRFRVQWTSPTNKQVVFDRYADITL